MKPSVAELAKPLLGKELIMRYAQRTDNAGQAPDTAASKLLGDLASGTAYSVVSREQKLKIVGVRDLDPESMRGPARARVFLPLKLAQNLHVMQPTDLRDMTRIGERSGGLLVDQCAREKSHPDSGGRRCNQEDGVQHVLNPRRDAELRQFFGVLDMFLGIFGSLALAVASIGIINTLVMAILERRREIGIMKAMGASDGDVKKLFFAEAGAMGILGGIVGVALGWAIGQVINFGTNIYLSKQDFPPEHFWSVPWWLVGAAIVFAFIVSLVSGLYPAGRAARLDPVQALRYE